MRMDWIKWPLNWHFTKTRPLHYCCYDWLTIPLSRHTCSHSVKNTSRSKKETDNVPTDKTEQVTCGMKQSLSLQILYFFKRNSNNIYHFVALQCVVTDHCSTSVLRGPIISSSLLDIAWNKHEWTSEGILFQPWKDINIHFFKFKLTNVNLLSSLVCLPDKNGRFSIMIGQTPCEGSVVISQLGLLHTSCIIL